MKAKIYIAGFVVVLIGVALVISHGGSYSSAMPGSAWGGRWVDAKVVSSANNDSNEPATPTSNSKPGTNQANPGGLVSGAATASGNVPKQPLSLVGGKPVSYPGRFAEASVQVGDKTYTLTPNQLGNFQRINLVAKQVVQVQVAYPQGSAGDAVSVEVEDGGHINDKQTSEVAALDDQNNVHFQFQPTDQAGIYRIALRSGSDVKVLNFWVGQEPLVRE